MAQKVRKLPVLTEKKSLISGAYNKQLIVRVLAHMCTHINIHSYR